MFLKTFRCFDLSPEIRIFELSLLVQILAKTKQAWSLDFTVWRHLLLKTDSLLYFDFECKWKEKGFKPEILPLKKKETQYGLQKGLCKEKRL